MNEKKKSEITEILKSWNNGETEAKELLIPYVYEELKRQAKFLMAKERQNHTLQATALVHEAFLKLSSQTGMEWKNRSHFYSIASQLMRQILIDHARLYMTEKRGNKPVYFSLEDVQVPIEEKSESIIILNDALERLEKLDIQQAKIVEMRFFGGMNNSEIADALGISERTVGRDWKSARLWLFKEINKEINP